MVRSWVQETLNTLVASAVDNAHATKPTDDKKLHIRD